MGKKIGGFVYWAPRLLSIFFLIFLALMSLDVFSEGSSFWEVFAGLLVHNIPVFILLSVLIISWKYEIVGGVIFILAGLLYAFLVLKGSFEWQSLILILQISGVAFLIGILFLVGWFKKKH